MFIKSKKFILLASILLIIGLIVFIQNKSKSSGLRVCPDELVISAIAGPDRSGATEDTFLPEATTSADQSFYVLNGENKAVQEFDTAWVASNCKVPVTNQ